MEWWKVIYWLIGTLGVAGTIALFVFFPGVASLVLRAVVRFFGWVLSYRVGCAVLAAILAFVVADYHRHSIDDADFAQRTAAFEQAQRDRDSKIAEETKADVWKEIADATADNVAIDKNVKGFEDALPPVPYVAGSNPFRLGANADRLCQIAGFAQCGRRKGAQPVRKTQRRQYRSGGEDRRGWRLPDAFRRGVGGDQQGHQGG